MYTEVIIINKHRFLTELEKFLTFLSEEEKQAVLADFELIFQKAASDEELIAALASPLKTAVEISRAFNKGGLEAARARCVEMSGLDMSEESPLPAELPEASPAEEPSADGEAQADADDTLSDADDAQADVDDAAVSEEPAEEPELVEAELVESVYSGENEPPEKIIQSDEFDEDPKTQEPAAEGELEADASGELEIADEGALEHGEEYIDTEPREYFEGADPSLEKDINVAKKLRPAALIFFVILAVPLGLIGCVLIIVAALALLAGAATMLGGGGVAVSLAFAGMTLFSDLIMTIGVALVFFAVGIVVLWLAVWVLIRGVGGFIKLIFRIARGFCYKEVAIL